MESGNEKENRGHNQTALHGGNQGQWKSVCGDDQRFYFINTESHASEWIPPMEVWSSKFGLPYGWEVGINGNKLKYYINHVNKTTTLDDPRSDADQATHLRMASQRSRKVQIQRDPSMGFGFVAGSEKPVVIRSVIPDGPSHNKLFANDQILRVKGEDVSDVAQEVVINLIKSCVDVLEIHVVSSEDLQDTKNQGQRRSSLMSRATRERRRSSPVNVRFADDIVQYIGPAEQARRGSLPVIPNVLKVFLENGQTRSFYYNPKTIVQEIFSSLGQKLGIKSMEHFCLVLSGPQKNQLSFIQNHEKVAEVYLNRNCSRSSWVCKLRLCFLPRNPNELFEKDPVAFSYLYDQISKDIVEGMYEIDLRYDLAIKLAALHMQQKVTESKKMPSKISVKSVEKDFDGLQHFVPENIVNGVKLKDLRKVLEQQIKFNQSLASLGQRYLSSNECKQQYLMVSSDLVSYGGKYFNVILYSYDWGTNGSGSNQSRKPKQQEATLLVSPRYGLSQMVKSKVNVLCQLADIEQITEFSIAFHAEGKRLLTISVAESMDTVLLMKPLDSMDLVTFIMGYQKLWKKPVAKLRLDGDTEEPLAPLTDNDIPPYATLHRVIPDSWSYPSFLTVPGNSSDHNFFVDLSKDPSSMNNEVVADDQDNKNTALKRSSEGIENENENSPLNVVPEKRLKTDETEVDVASKREAEDDKSRGLYMIAEEENSSSNNDEEETAGEDYISQLALAEEIWREEREQEQLTITDGKHREAGENGKMLSNSDRNHLGQELRETEVLSDSQEPETMLSVCDGDDTTGSTTKTSDNTDSVIEVDSNDIDIRLDGTTNSKELVNLNIGDLKRETSPPTDGMDDENGQCLDINDIDIDDRSDGAPSPRSSLADFSFAGDVLKLEPDSSVKLQTMDRSTVSSSSSENHATITDSSTEAKEMKENDATHITENQDSASSPTETNFDPLLPDTNEKKKYFSKKLIVDELELGEKVFHSKVLSENDCSSKEDAESEISSLSSQSMDINNDASDSNSNGGDEGTGVKLLSYARKSGGIEQGRSNNVTMQDMDTVDDSVKDSDSSSLNSHGSWNFVYEVNAGAKTEGIAVDLIEKDSNRDSLKRESDSEADFGEVAGSTEADANTLPEVLPITIDIGEDHIGSSSDEIKDDLTQKGNTLVSETATPGAERLHSIRNSQPPLTLFLGGEPGESEDAPLSIQEETDILDEEDFSLMDWIIPPPPDSTQELKDSDITVASPPPSIPAHELISSPPVELPHKLFDDLELEIDSLVVPPPPLGSMEAVVKIVSPPPILKKDSSKTYDEIIKKCVNTTKEVDSNTKKLDNLSLSDGDDLVSEGGTDRFRSGRLLSSESSSSLGGDFDSSDSTNYNSDCMVSCYSLSNDSQRNSEDEIFEEFRTSSVRKRQDQLGQRFTLGSKDQFENLQEEDDAMQRNEWKEGEERKGDDRRTKNNDSHKTDLVKTKPEYLNYDQERSIEPLVNLQELSSSRNDSLIFTRDKTQPMSNGLSTDYDDYDCLDDVILNSTNHNSPTMRGKFEIPRRHSKTAELPRRYVDEEPTPKVNDTFAHDETVSGQREVLGLPNDNDTSLSSPQMSPEKTSSLPSSSGKDLTSHSKEIIDHENGISKEDASSLDDRKNKCTPTPPHLSKDVDGLLVERDSNSEPMISMFPGYLLKQSTAESSVNITEERISTQERDVTSNSNDPSDYDTLDLLDKEEMSDRNDINEDDASGNKFHTAKLETKQLADRLELRIQGCVEDCKNAVLKSSYFSYSNNSKWKETVQENARYFTTDIKRLNTTVQEMNDDNVFAAIKSSQETLQSLVSSFARASSTQSKISLYSIRILAGILNDVISLYDDVIGKTEEAVASYPDKKKCKVVAERTAAMNTLMASLGRTLKRV